MSQLIQNDKPQPIPWTPIKHDRVCVRRNYVPHSTPTNSDYNKWKSAYDESLMNMFEAMNEHLSQNYDTSYIDLYSDTNFESFCKFIFESSSGYYMFKNLNVEYNDG